MRIFDELNHYNVINFADQVVGTLTAVARTNVIGSIAFATDG